MKHSYIIAFWSPFALSPLHFCTDFFSAFLQKYGNIQCLDCQNDRDARTMHLLHQADLVVIGLPQNKHALDDYFGSRTEPLSNVIYMVMNYFSDGVPDIHTISHFYRIPDIKIACLPYNVRFLDAVRIGRSRQYLDFSHTQSGYENAILFQRELCHSAKMFLLALGIS